MPQRSNPRTARSRGRVADSHADADQREPTSALPQPTVGDLRKAYRWMLVARRVDETMWTLRRQGKGHFVVSSAGHEGIGAAAGLAADMHQDFLAPHYRDLTACLAWGLQPREALAHYFGRAADPCTG